MPREFVKQLLEVDAAVIADNEKYFVVAVRVEKSFINNNHQLLVTLSDLARDGVPKTEPQKKAAWRRTGTLMMKAGAALVSHPAMLTLNWLLQFGDLIS